MVYGLWFRFGDSGLGLKVNDRAPRSPASLASTSASLHRTPHGFRDWVEGLGIGSRGEGVGCRV